MAADAQPPVLFVHIPKTAGTTVKWILFMNAPFERMRKLANVFKGAGGAKTDFADKLRRKGRLDVGEARFVRGHFPLGVRELLPEGVETRAFAFLREPVERTLSHFSQIVEVAARRDQPSSYVRGPLPAGATLDKAVELGYVHDNLQTRMLSGLAEPFGTVDDEMLERAKRNLRGGMDAFGVVERFDESLVLLKTRLGLRTVFYWGPARVNEKRPRGDDVPEALRRAAERHNRYDIELYSYASELMDKLPERDRLEFQVEVAALRAVRGHTALPTPPAFVGDERDWQTHVDERASSLCLECDRELERVASVARTDLHWRGLASLEFAVQRGTPGFPPLGGPTGDVDHPLLEARAALVEKRTTLGLPAVRVRQPAPA